MTHHMHAVPFKDAYWFGTPCCGQTVGNHIYEHKEFEVVQCPKCHVPFGVFNDPAAVPATLRWNDQEHSVGRSEHPLRLTASPNTLHEVRLAEIEVCSGDRPRILTQRFYGDTSRSILGKLTAALEPLGFTDLCLCVHVSITTELLGWLVVEETDDRPGLPLVTMKCRLTCRRPFFLPRNQATGEFVAIYEQAQCLAAIRHPRRG